LRIVPLPAPLGAIVQGFDPALAPTRADAHALQAALGKHLLLLFKSPLLSPPQLLAFAANFGVPEAHGIVSGIPAQERISEIRKEPWHVHNYGGTWHSDLSFMACPPVATVLQAKELPARGGDTLWSNQYLAYDSLAPGLRERVDALTAEHVSHIAFNGMAQEVFSALHPLAPVHPGTRRRYLYANPVSIVRLVADGADVGDGVALLASLVCHAIREETQYRHRWAAGDILVWDNRSTMHMAMNDYAGQRRVMHRVVVTSMDDRLKRHSRPP